MLSNGRRLKLGSQLMLSGLQQVKYSLLAKQTLILNAVSLPSSYNSLWEYPFQVLKSLLKEKKVSQTPMMVSPMETVFPWEQNPHF